jgi:nucleoside-diphosphate-sugar epimerase
MKVIITGATGMVGEGVLLECLENPAVSQILIVGRRHYNLTHPKVKELLIPDFLQSEKFADQLAEYDACFFCAGVSSVGMNETDYSKITYDTTLTFAKTLVSKNPNMVFNFVTGAGTDSSEKGKTMWARVKGKTENDLMKLGFKGQYNFRPGLMVPTPGQKSLKTSYRILAAILKNILPKSTLTLVQVGRAMIHSVSKGYSNQILEVADIKKLAE